ncbi:MAG TPA: hypothetical protein VGN17_14580 [Bryobacteraceae bacterium]|jgi:hypothetical protein
MKLVLTCAALFAVSAFAGDDTERAKLSGSWQQNDIVWTIQDKGVTVHITRSEGTKIVADFDCNATGQDCQGKDSGHKATVTLWFNGPALVQMETKGEEVVKRRFAVAAQGDTLELQTIPLTPAGPTETVQLKRVAATVSAR